MSTLRKALALFSPRERLKLGALFAATLAMGALEMIGVASIMPFMALVSDPSRISDQPWANHLYEYFGFASTQSFLFAAGVAVLVLMTMSNAFGAATTWLTLRFMWTKHHRLSKQLLAQYIARPYAFFLNQNTSALSKNVLAEVTEVVHGIFVPMMHVLGRGLIATALLLLLMLVDVVLALTVAAVLGGTYTTLYLFFRRRQTRFGRERLRANAARYKVATEALVGIKDVKVLGREADFLTQFDAPSRRLSRLMAANAILGQLPRYVLESLAFGALLIVVLYLLQTRSSINEILPLVSLYALAGYRLMPALQQVFQGLTRIRFNKAALDDLYADLNRDAAHAQLHIPGAHCGTPSRVPFQETIEVVDLSYRYPETDSYALAGVSLSIRKNTTLGLVGSSGSGKTTLVDVILGLLPATSGQIRVDGVAIDQRNARSWRIDLGYVPQQIFLSDDTIARNIALGVPEHLIDMAAVRHAASIAELSGFVEQLPLAYDTMIGERGMRLSGGQRQRIGIARALYSDPQVLILDEATSALDGITEDAVMCAIRVLTAHKTIIVIAHRLSTVAQCDEIVVMDRGKVASRGSYRDLVASNQGFRRMVEITASAGVQ